MPHSRADIPAVPLVRTDQGEPTVSDRYELRSVLGSGGMGTVWEAYDKRLGRTVALKVLRDDLPATSRARLEYEARAAARINDPRVVTVLDLDATHDGTPYLVLECHDGVTLADELRRADGPLPPERFDQLVDDLLGALSAAHERGVLHRDVKPANVLAGPKGFRVTDFGLASLDDDQSTENDLMGTLVYVAPERLEGARGSTRSDVFSAAVVLYEAASGVQPFRADDPAESIARLRAGDAPRLPDHLPLSLRTALHRALAAAPEERPADAGELLALIQGDLDAVADPTVVLDATSVLPRATAEDPTEDVFARTRAHAPVPEPAPSPEPVAETATSVFADEPVVEPTIASEPVVVPAPAATPTPEPAVAAPPVAPEPVPAVHAAPHPVQRVALAAPPEVRAPRPSTRERIEPFLELVRRRPEVGVAAAGAAILLFLLLVVAIDAANDTGDPVPADPAAEAPASLDEVLDRIEEVGR